MPELSVDERGRITFPRKIIEDRTQKFVAIKVRGDIILKPLPKDPIATLKKLGEKIPKDMSVSDMKKLAREAAMEEVDAKLQRLEKLGKTRKRAVK